MKYQMLGRIHTLQGITGTIDTGSVGRIVCQIRMYFIGDFVRINIMHEQHLSDGFYIRENLTDPTRVIEFIDIIGFGHIAKSGFQSMQHLIVYGVHVDK